VSITVYTGHDKDKSTFFKKYNAAQVTTQVLATTL